MSIKRRIRKLETVQAKANGGLVIITCGPDDDAEELQCERSGLDGPPPDATVLLVNTGVPQAKPLITKSGHWKGRPVRQNSSILMVDLRMPRVWRPSLDRPRH